MPCLVQIWIFMLIIGLARIWYVTYDASRSFKPQDILWLIFFVFYLNFMDLKWIKSIKLNKNRKNKYLILNLIMAHVGGMTRLNQVEKVGPFVKNWSFKDSWLWPFHKNFSTSPMHILLNFDHMNMFLDILERSWSPLTNAFGTMSFGFTNLKLRSLT